MPWWMYSIMGFTAATLVIIDLIYTWRKMNKIEKDMRESQEDFLIHLKKTVELNEKKD